MSDDDRPTPIGDVMCAEPLRAVAAGLFPPRDADAETYRRHVAACPWPEVVFASAVTG